MLRQPKPDSIRGTQLFPDRQPYLGRNRPQAGENEYHRKRGPRCAQARQEDETRDQIGGDDQGRKAPQSSSIETYELILAASEAPKIAETVVERGRRPNSTPRQDFESGRCRPVADRQIFGQGSSDCIRQIENFEGVAGEGKRTAPNRSGLPQARQYGDRTVDPGSEGDAER